MKIKLIDFGLKAGHHPFRPHDNDAGADVFIICFISSSSATLNG